MLTGRITYGLGQTPLDQYGQPMLPAGGGLLSQTTVTQTPIAQWGATEWAIVIGLGVVAYSVIFTGKRGVQRVRGALYGRRQRLARQHEAASEHYRSYR